MYKSGSPDGPRLQFYGRLTVTQGDKRYRLPAIATSNVTLGPVAACT